MTRKSTTLSIPTPSRAKTRATKNKSVAQPTFLSRTIMPERGIDLAEIESWLEDDVHALNWELFVDPPAQATSELVIEFLKVATKENLPIVTIKGAEVNCSENEINESLSTTPVPEEKDEYLRYCLGRNDEAILDEIIQNICHEGATWGAGGYLERKTLKYEAKVWLHFVNSRLIPATHDSRVSWERAVLVFCIVKRKPFDVGRIICSQLIANVERKGPFYFPCLVSELCRRAGVTASDPELEETIPMITPIDQGTLKRIRKNEGLDAEGTEELEGTKSQKEKGEKEEKKVEKKGKEKEEKEEKEEEKDEESENSPQDSPAKKTTGRRGKRMKLAEGDTIDYSGQTMFGFGADLLARQVQHLERMVGVELQNLHKATKLIMEENAKWKELAQCKELVAQAEKGEEGQSKTPGTTEALNELTQAVNSMKEELLQKKKVQDEERTSWSNEMKELKEELLDMKQKELQLWRYIKFRDSVMDENWEAKFRKQIRFPAFPDILPPELLLAAPDKGATPSNQQ